MIKELITLITCTSQLEDEISIQKLIELNKHISKTVEDFEFIIVDNINSTGANHKENILSQMTNTRIIKLSKNVSLETGHILGLRICIGDFIVLFNPILDSKEVVLDGLKTLLKTSSETYLIGKLNSRSPKFFLRSFFYKLALKFSNTQIDGATTSFRILQRHQVNALNRANLLFGHITVQLHKLGFVPHYYDYKPSGFYSRNFRTYLDNFITLIMSNTGEFLRNLSVLGLSGSLISLCFAIYAIISKLLLDNVVEGWASTTFIISFFFSILFFYLTFLGEFLLRNSQSHIDTLDSLVSHEILSNKLDRLILNIER